MKSGDAIQSLRERYLVQTEMLMRSDTQAGSQDGLAAAAAAKSL